MAKLLGRILSATIVIGAIVIGLVVLRRVNDYPRTDDAELVANFIGIAPQVDGPIVRLNVRDNQFVKQGDLLYEIDDRPLSLRSGEGDVRAGRPRGRDPR